MATPPNPLDTSGAAPSAAPTHKKVTCEFCACVLAPSGEIVNMSDTARGYRDAAEKHRTALEQKDKEITELREKLRLAETERDALKGSPQKKGKFL
jgi:hypothetical protein